MSIFDDLAAGAYQALNSALFGAPEVIVKAIGDDDADRRLEAWKKSKEGAMRVGDIVGTIGSMLIPGGAISKGVGKGIGVLAKGAEGLKLGRTAETIGKGARALDMVGDIIKGSRKIGTTGGRLAKTGGLALRGALGSMESALPRAALSGDTENILPSLASGALLGPLTGALSAKLEKGIRDSAAKIPGRVTMPSKKPLWHATPEELIPKPGKLTRDRIEWANKRGLAGKGEGMESYYTPVLQRAYDLGLQGVDLARAPSVTGWRFGKMPESGISRNYLAGTSEKGLSLAGLRGEKATPSSMWFSDRPKSEYTGILSGLGSDGEPIILPFDVADLD